MTECIYRNFRWCWGRIQRHSSSFGRWWCQRDGRAFHVWQASL